jgi:hypothetical protein
LRWNDRWNLHVQALRRGGASHVLLVIRRIDGSGFNAWRHNGYAIRKKMLDSTTSTLKRSFEKRSVVDLADSANGESFERLVASYPSWLG